MSSGRGKHDAFAILAVVGISVLGAAVLFSLLHRPAPNQTIEDPSPPVTSPGSLIIIRGGTYSGHWTSEDPKVPAVLVQTDEPVIIENSTLRGRGDLIATAVDHTRITVRNTRGFGLNPNVAGRAPGRFLTAENCDSATLENNDLIHTAGIYFLSYGGDFTPRNTIKVLRNRVRDIDGRKSDGHNGWLNFNTRIPRGGGPAENGFIEAQFVALDKVRHVGGIEIAWNEVINDPGDSRVEDNINIYLSSGTRENHLRIHDNFIRGAYTIQPDRISGRDARYEYDWQFSGGGILLGDGAPDSPDDAPAFVEAYENHVISTSNYGIAIEVGHDSVFHHNRVLSAGLLPGGGRIAAQNVGAGIWDGHHGAARVAPTFFNNSGHDNLIGWVKESGRNDWWIPDAAGWANNRHWPGPVDGDAEQAEWILWNKKLSDAGLVIGASPEQSSAE